VTTFAYDGFGRRIRKTSAVVGTLEYLWDGDQIIAEVDGGGSRAVVQTYTYYPGIDQPRSVTTGGETYFMSTEPDGTINGLIRKSDRAVVAQFTYTPWGELETASQSVNPAINRLRWKGLPYDPESGFYYMRARYYDPKIRRFISEDPIGLSGGINAYAFAGGDPVNGSDPSGLEPQGNGYTGCWELDQTITWTKTEYTVNAWRPVPCGPFGPYGPSLSRPRWEPRSGAPFTAPTGQTTAGGFGTGGRAMLATAGRKVLACKDEVAGLALSAIGSASFIEGATITAGLARSYFKAVNSTAGRGGNLMNAARRYAREVAYGGLTTQSAAATVTGLLGNPMLAWNDTYMTAPLAKSALKLALGFVPVVGTGIAFVELVECLYQK
jgi:RHS repeat-associated protein